jgi:glutamate synthase domain-containing protein 3
MRPDVKWANGVEGGFVYGRDAVREYWTNQYKVIQVQLETLKFETDENNRNVVTSLYEIGETETIQEMIQKTRTPNE